MAVTKIWPIKATLERPIEYIQNPKKTNNPEFGKNQDDSLEDVIDYASNGDKTERKYFVSAINCSHDYARKEFIIVKKQFGKDGGIVAFHGYQSFAKDEKLTPKEAHEIGKELAQTLWGDRFQVVIATHLNTECLHNHFVFNSVSFVDGKRFYASRGTYALMRKESDRICKEHGLSVLEKGDMFGRKPYLPLYNKSGMPTIYGVMKEALDEALSKSCTKRDLEDNLRAMGFEPQFYPNRKFWTLRAEGWGKGKRIYRIGPGYTNEEILAKLKENPESVRFQSFQKKEYRTRQYNLPTRTTKIKKHKGLKGLYLRYCYELGYLPKYKFKSTKVTPALRDDIAKVEMLSKQVRLLCRENIETSDDLDAFLSKQNRARSTLCCERDELRKVLRRVVPEEDKDKARERIKEITKELKSIYVDVKLGMDIKEKNKDKEAKIEQLDKDEKRRLRGKNR